MARCAVQVTKNHRPDGFNLGGGLALPFREKRDRATCVSGGPTFPMKSNTVKTPATPPSAGWLRYLAEIRRNRIATILRVIKGDAS